MIDRHAFASALTMFAAKAVEDYDVHTMLELVGSEVCRVVGVDGAGITLKVLTGDTATQYISATDMTTLHVERSQDELAEGPCVDAINGGEPVAVPDITRERRWPRYRPVVTDAGYRRVAGIPMLAGGRVIGALNTYGRSSGEWSDDQIVAATAFANIATVAIANAATIGDQARVVAQLQHALDSRVIIEQAKGVIAERYGITLEHAFEALRRHARNQRAKVHDVAGDVLTGRQDIPIEPPRV